MIERLTALFGVLPSLWEMSLTAAYVTAVVVALRLILKKRAPRQVLCLLWLVVFARLLIPVSLESPLSIVPDAQQVQERFEPVVNAAQGLGAWDQHGASGQNQPGGAALPPASQGAALSVPEGTVPAAPQAPAQFPWQALAAGVWLAGAAAMCLYGLISYLGLRRRLFDAIRARDGAWEHPAVQSPFILGVLRPRIYLPVGLWGEPRRFILCHERAHLRRLDHIVKPVCWLALAIHWFNPAVWIAFIVMSRDIEAACDEAVLRQLGPQVKADYSATLLSLATNGRVPAPCPLSFDEGNARGRIKNVLGYRRPALWIVVVSVVMALMAAVCLLTDPVAAVAPDPGPSPTPAQEEGLNALLEPWALEVLRGERTFRTPYGEREYRIDELKSVFYGDDQFPDLAVGLGGLAILDLDRDGIDELVIWPSGSLDGYTEIGYATGSLILRRQGDMVYAYTPGYESFMNPKADGTFNWSRSAGSWGTGSARFPDGMFTVDNITWQDDSSGDGVVRYYVDGLQVSAWEEFNTAFDAHVAKPGPEWYVFEDGQLKPDSIKVTIPLDDTAMSVPAPDFLDKEQQILYYQTFIVYSHLFSSSSESVDPDGYGRGTPREYNGAYYWPFTNEYADWDTFEALVKSVFTDDFWTARGGSMLYVNIDGVTHYMDWGRGGGGYNENFPETFQLVERTDDAISFIMTGYYSDTRQYMDATDGQIQAWLAAGWEYSIDFPMRMVRTEDGWRFDEFHNARTDNGIYYSQQVPNPNAPDMDSIPVPDPSEAEVCAHGLDHVHVDTLDGAVYSTQIAQAHDTSMVFRCLEDGFTYVVPAPITGRDYWFGGCWEGDFDGDGRIEQAILSENAGLIMVCDVKDGQFITCTTETASLADQFNQGLTYRHTDSGGVLTLELSYLDQSIRREYSGSERELVLGYGGADAPVAAQWNADVEAYTGRDIILSLPIYVEGSVERFQASGGRETIVLVGTAQWTFHYSGGSIQYAADSFRLLPLPEDWVG